MSLTTGVGLGALNVILIRSGDALQTAQGIGTVILDKTGTITHGKPILTDVVTAGGVDEVTLLRLAGGVERSSEHPLAAAILFCHGAFALWAPAHAQLRRSTSARRCPATCGKCTTAA